MAILEKIFLATLQALSDEMSKSSCHVKHEIKKKVAIAQTNTLITFERVSLAKKPDSLRENSTWRFLLLSTTTVARVDPKF